MKILQICHKIPFPPCDGGTIAMNNITQGLLRKGHYVRVLAMETPKMRVRKNELFDEYVKKVKFESVFVDTSISFSSALKTVFQPHISYHVSRFYSKIFANKLSEILKQESFDIIHLESIFTTPYLPIIRQFSQAKVILRTHNVEHQIWKRVVKNESNIFKKLALKYLTKRLEKYECGLGKQIDAFASISSPDFHFFSKCFSSVPGKVIPFGIDLDQYPENEEYIPSDIPELFHVGSMNWLPNIEGIEWFLNEIWPEINALYPEITFTIAGRDIPKRLISRKDNNLVIAGEVPSANDFMLSKDIMIVPLLSGSGIRVKIIEGMALGKTIISTSIGAEGLDIENGKHILIANTPEEFVAAITQCVHTPDLCAIIGENARNFVALNFNNDLITNELIGFYQQVLENENR